MQFLLQGGKLLFRPHGQHFYGAIWVIADPTGKSELPCFKVYKPAEADALDPPSDSVAPGSHAAYARDR